MFCAKCGKKTDEDSMVCFHAGQGKKILLIGIIGCLLLTGCSGKGSSRDESAEGYTDDSNQYTEDDNAVDDEKAALEAELAAAKEELANAQEKLADFDKESYEDREEPVQQEPEEASEEELKQAEYLENLHAAADSWMYSQRSYKFTYYADDINKDGFPELIMLGDRNTGLGNEQELFFLILIYQEYWNEEKRKMEQLAVSGGLTDVFYSDVDTVPESGVLEFSYTADGSNIVSHIYSSKNRSSSANSMFRGAAYVISDKVCLYKDNEILHNGERSKAYYELDYKEPEFRYLTIDAKWKTWSDEESYNDLPVPECDKTVRFTARCGWKTVDEALEHLGELPQ